MAQTNQQSDADFPHGTTYGYRKACRCDLCKEAKALEWVEYKERERKKQHEPRDPNAPVTQERSLGEKWFEGLAPDEVELLTGEAFYLIAHRGMDLIEASQVALQKVIEGKS